MKNNLSPEGRNKVPTAEKAILCLLFLLSAFAGALAFSPSTSPAYSDWGYDSAMFQTIGKYWAEGYLPYVSLFDHKGPIIFFINAVGYILGGRGGVFVLQLVALAAAECFAYMMLRRSLSGKLSLVLTLALPLVLSATWQEGNTTEEYILPLLFASYYCMLRWCEGIEEGRWEHPAGAAYLYGLSFAFALLTRVTNALGVCVATAFVVVCLIAKGLWRNLFKNALAFVLGSLSLIVPFSLYFAAKGALYEMWYGTVIFNLSYMASHKDALAFSLVDFLLYVRRCLCGFALVFAALWSLLFRKNGKPAALLWLLVSVVSVAFLYGQNAYDHYATVLLPLFVIALCLMAAPLSGGQRNKLDSVIAVLLCLCVFASAMYKTYKGIVTVQPPSAYEYYGDEYAPVLASLPEEGRDSFIAIDCPRRLYLEMDLRPDFRFFTLQTWMGLNSDAMQDQLCDELLESRVEWILLMDMGQPRLPELIRESYELVDTSEKGIYQLYRIK